MYRPQTEILIKAFGLLAAATNRQPKPKYEYVTLPDGRRYQRMLERSRYDGARLRQIRAERGCGRPIIRPEPIIKLAAE